MEYPIFSFSIFYFGAHFENALGEGAHRKIVLLTLQILVLWAVSLQNNMFVDLWEGCMMGLPILQPTKLCMHDVLEIMFLGLFLRVSWQNLDTNNNPSHTILVTNESTELILSICVNYSDDIYL